LAHQPFHLPDRQALFSTDTSPDAPPEGERWSSWDTATHGPVPRPHWVITDLGAVEADLGILKSGKEADVHVVRRWIPGTDRSIALAAKRFRSSEHRMFHRDAGYLEGRRVRRSREMRAMASRTEFGKELLTGQWAHAEFAALGTLWSRGLAVPYPVQLDESEMLMEFIGDDGREGPVAAPRLHQVRVEEVELTDLFEQFRVLLLDPSERR
jgi:RIO kinase 1